VADVFISYSRRDKAFVLQLHEALQRRGRSAWVDWEGIPPSAEWMKEISGAIEASDAFIFVIGPDSVASAICAEEVAHAVSLSKRLIPVVWRRVDEKAVAAAVRERNWIFFDEGSDFEQALGQLFTALETDFDWLRAHTRLLTRAIEWEAHQRDSSFTIRGADLRAAEAHLALSGEKEPRLTQLQISYILRSRRAATNQRRAVAATLGLLFSAAIISGLIFWQKRQEERINRANALQERAISALARNSPLEAETLLSKALSIQDRPQTRENLIEARARSARLLAMGRVAQSSVLAFDPDGLKALVVAADALVLIDSQSRQRLATIPTDHKAGPAVLGRNAALLAIATRQGVELWRLDSAQAAPPQLLAVPDDQIISLALSGDGKTLVGGGRSSAIYVWRLDSQPASQPRRLEGHADQVGALALSRDGKTLVSGSWDNTAKVWDLASGVVLHTLRGHSDNVQSVAISPDGELIATGAWDDKILIWSRANGARLRVLEGHQGGVLALRFSGDGSLLLSGSEDLTARLWNAETGRHILTLRGHRNYVDGVAFLTLTGQQRLLCADSEGFLRLWDIGAIGERLELQTLRGHEGPVSTAAFNAAASELVSGGWDNSVRLWDLRSRQPAKILRGHMDAVLDVKFAPDGRIASSGKDGQIRLWDRASGEAEILAPNAPLTKVRSLAFSPDGRFLVAGCDDGSLRVWTLPDKSFRLIAAHPGAKVLGIAISPDGAWLATASQDKTIKLWNTATWEQAAQLTGHTDVVWTVAFASDGGFLVSGGDDRTVRLWDVASRQPIGAPLRHPGSVWSVDIGPDGRTIAAGVQDSTVQLWTRPADAAPDKFERAASLRLAEGPVWFVKFSRDRQDTQLAIAGADKTIRLWSPARFAALADAPAALIEDARQETGLAVIEEGANHTIEIVPADHSLSVGK
jgi:WD40 repeat protein